MQESLALSESLDYLVTRGGEVWISEPDGVIRQATATEWLEIWKTSPALTLTLADRQRQVRR